MIRTAAETIPERESAGLAGRSRLLRGGSLAVITNTIVTNVFATSKFVLGDPLALSWLCRQPAES